MADVTAIILTKNEEKNIRACLESISGFVKRTVVVDSGSEDNTVETAKALGADVYENPFCYYAQQFNWGLNNTGIQTEWALRLDADERFTSELCEECEKLLASAEGTDINGIAMEADLYFLGRLMKHGLANRRTRTDDCQFTVVKASRDLVQYRNAGRHERLFTIGTFLKYTVR